jgi:hypothetical protein
MSHPQPQHPQQSLLPLLIAVLACLIGSILIGN